METFQTELRLMREAVKVCNQRDRMAEEISAYNRAIDAQYDTDEEVCEQIYDRYGKKTMALIVSAILALLIGGLLELILTWLKAPLILAMAPTILFFVLTAVFYNRYEKIVCNAHRDEIENYVQLRERAIAEKPALRTLRDQKAKELKAYTAHMRQEGVCCIPQHYWDAANRLLWYLENRRAATLTEALNLYEYECREEERTQLMRRQARASESAAYDARIAAQNSEVAATNAQIAAAASGVAACFSILSYASRND